MEVQIQKQILAKDKIVRFIDLFAGLGGIRIGFEEAMKKHGYKTACVMSSEIKPYAIKAYQNYFNNDYMKGDITQISTDDTIARIKKVTGYSDNLSLILTAGIENLD